MILSSKPPIFFTEMWNCTNIIFILVGWYFVVLHFCIEIQNFFYFKLGDVE